MKRPGSEPRGGPRRISGAGAAELTNGARGDYDPPLQPERPTMRASAKGSQLLRRRAAPLLLALPLLLSACGIIRSTTGIDQARKAVAEAEKAQAMASAPYELTLAQEYLAKAREEQAYNDYQTAEELAKKSHEYAGKALEVATHGRPKKTPEGLMDKKALEALPEQGEVERQRQEHAEDEPVLQPTGPSKVLQEDEADIVSGEGKEGEKGKGGDGGSESKGTPAPGAGGGDP